MADFDDLMGQLNDLDTAKSQRAQKMRELQAQHSETTERLKQLSKKRNDLINQETNLKNNSSQIQESLSNLKSEEAKAQNSRDVLLKKLNIAKQKRNADLMTWWMQTYSEFDSMSLKELQDWLVKMIKCYKSTLSSADTAGDKSPRINTTDVERERLRRLRLEKEGEHSLQSTRAKTDSKTLGEVVTNSVGQSLSEKQRIQINRDENNPIDTLSEAQDAEDLASPLGNREAEDDADDFLDKVSGFDDDDHFPDKKKETADILKDLEL